MKVLKRIAIVAMVVAAAATGSLAASEPAEARPCGYDQWAEVYNHCGNTRIVIAYRDVWWMFNGTHYTCVGPGETYLGHLRGPRIVNAYYVGFRC
jgi:Family of unknown function (DUF6355)